MRVDNILLPQKKNRDTELNQNKQIETNWNINHFKFFNTLLYEKNLFADKKNSFKSLLIFNRFEPN